MDTLAALLIVALVVGVLTFLGLAADAWGVDSRPTIGDTHAR